MSTKRYVDLNGITAYDEEIKDYIAGLGVGITYTLSQDATDPHKLILTPSRGTAQEVTVPDNNTTYSLSASGNNLVLTPSSGTADTITVPFATDSSTVNGYTVGTNVPSDAEFTDTTYESKTAVSGGTDVSLVTTGEKYNWNAKADNTQTFTEASTRANIASGETLSTLFGKIKKFFTDLSTVAFSGSYNDLSNTPTIPTVNDATLTIQKNGTSVGTFTANASSDTSVNVTVPTAVSELTNDSGYTTNTGTVTSVATGAGLTGGTITGTGTVKADLASETLSSLASASITATTGRQYAVGLDSNGKLSVNVPWSGGTSATILTATLAASSTTVTFTNSAITSTARYDIYAENLHDMSYTDVVISGTTMTITFAEAPESDTTIKLVINTD